MNVTYQDFTNDTLLNRTENMVAQSLKSKERGTNSSEILLAQQTLNSSNMNYPPNIKSAKSQQSNNFA